MLQLRPRKSLDGGDYGWLKARHHFAVNSLGNANHGPIGSIVVWNDDEIAPGTGFGLHGHANMEIISYVREGAVTHRDSLGNRGVTQAGDVQVMSAGSGVRHSEHNEGKAPLKLFQIWIRPRSSGGEPFWNSRQFPKDDRANRWTMLASGLPQDDDALPIRADARVLGTTLREGASLSYAFEPRRHAYIAPATGSIEINGLRLDVGDGLAVSDEKEITVRAISDSELILVDAA